MTFVLTFVAAQHHSQFEKDIISSVDEHGLKIEDITTLHKFKAFDVITDAVDTAQLKDIRTKLQCDVFIQKHNSASRRKKLFLSDMDATIVEEETLDELAAALGLKDQIAQITAATMRGELNFEDSVKKRVAMLKNLPLTALEHTYNDITFSKGARTVLKTLTAHKVHCTLVSGGFTYFTNKVAQELGFKENFGNVLGISDDKLNGEVIPPIRGKEFKAALLQDQIKTLGISLSDTLCTGDGANDADMLTLSQSGGGLGIGYQPKPLLEKQLNNTIIYGSLTSVLYAMGYSEDEILFCEDE